MTRRLSILVGAVSLGSVVAVVTFDAADRSPGPLSAVHAALPRLAGSKGCDACHGRAGSSMREACESCHTAIGRQVAAGTGFHGGLGRRARSCAPCHVEHHGDEHPVLARKSFELASVPDPDAYDHRGLGFRLRGKHTRLACVACHPNAARQPLAPGQKRFLGLSQDCTACHRDRHEGRLGSDCKSCHGETQPFSQAASFVHDSRFPLRGGHAGRDCRDCHAEPLARATAVRACVDCHESPHVAGGKPGHVIVRESRDCSRCHDTEHFQNATFGPAEHRAIGVVLEGAHERASCIGCHSETAPRADRLAVCTDCHDSPHGEPFMARVAQLAGTERTRACAQCHTPRSWRPGGGARALHRASGFRLVAPHEGLDCGACHGSEAPYAVRYPGRSAGDCTACHGDPHGGDLAHGAFEGDRCIDCHARDSFMPPAFDVAKHDRTRFRLDGGHAAVACSACHRTKIGGRPRTFHGLGRACETCHDDAHRGAFDRPGIPRVAGGRRGCARCHTTRSFAAVDGFDHARWTGYALVGRHASAACGDCHPAAANRKLGVASRACASCHEDPHGGQFRIAGSVDCARCHSPETGFDHTSFDHARQSRFKLDRDHAKLSCRACHKREPASGAVRYRPLGTKCQDCHTPGGRRGR